MVRYNDSAKHIHRLPPCPVYDIAGMEAWLEDMAKEGYLLARDGFFLGFADFEVAKPVPMKYRLQAAPKARSAFDEGEPDAEEMELSEALGWEYVARRGDFHIYRSADPAARELNTDPHVQAMALNEVMRRSRSNTLAVIIETIFWFVVYPVLLMDFRVVTFSTVIGTGLGAFILFVFIWSFFQRFSKARRLKALRDKLRLGESATGKADWRKGALRYRITHVSHKLCIAALSIAIVCVAITNYADGNDIPFSQLDREPPFATMADFCPDAEYTPNSHMSYLGLNTAEIWHAAIAPENWYWRESAGLKLDGLSFSGSLYVNYHETVSPLLARAMAWEYHMENRRDKYYEELSLPELGVDYAIAYQSNAHFYHVIIQNGCQIIHALFNQYGDNTLRLEQWAAVLAESIK